MDKDEMKLSLRDVISSLIKGEDPEVANQKLHDVLSAKMRERVNPTPEVDPTEVDGEAGDPDEDNLETDEE